MKRQSLLTASIFICVFTSACQFASPNRLVGHSYIIKPISGALTLRLMAGLNTITHEYESNSTVKVVTYAGTDPVKSEELTYSFDGNTYRMDDEIYDVSFRKDTVVFSVNGEEYLDMVPVGEGKDTHKSESTDTASDKSIGGGSSIKIYHKNTP